MKKILTLVLVIIMLLSLCACSQKTDEKEIETDIQNADKTEVVTEKPQITKEPIPKGIEHVNILLMGSMTKDFSIEGNTYCLTHILITLDPKTRTIKFTTFPYNLAVDIDGGAKTVQMQEVCSMGGEEKVIEVLNENFGVSIDYWIVMNMNGVIETIDALKGIEIDITSLSINEAAKHTIDMLGLVWEEVENIGLQKLSGIQVAGYFVDTIPKSDDWMSEEEQYFREHHSNIIKGVISSVNLLEFTSDDFVNIASAISGNYATNIPDDSWKRIAETAVYCLENEAEFLHVPEDIEQVETSDGWQSIGFNKETDTKAVQKFANE